MSIFIIEIYNGEFWVPIPSTCTREEAIAQRILKDRESSHPHIKYRVARYIRARVGR